MSIRRLAKVQPESFELSTENKKWAKDLIKKYPKGRQESAVIPLLWKVQEQNSGWVSEPAIRCVANFLDMPYIRVFEIVTFYTMFNLQPVGKYHLQLCGTTPCMLRGAEDLKEVCKKHIGDQMQVTENGLLSWVEVECLGACVNAPVIQFNSDFVEDLTAEALEKILLDLKDGRPLKTGSVINRVNSAPQGYKHSS